MPTPDSSVTHIGLALCECGHPLDKHADSGWGPQTVCVEKLSTFPDGGYHGVCSCVRTGDIETDRHWREAGPGEDSRVPPAPGTFHHKILTEASRAQS